IQDLWKYAGRYTFDGGFVLKLEVVDAMLQVTQLWDAQAYPLYPESRTSFFEIAGDTSFEFMMNDDGEVTSLTVAGQLTGQRSRDDE
ncbi:MAG: DUF3471 domain-containing protein, partial [Saprospiraceae bacterium]|nr:DUF3471 domain-containing protein [Saprospiraceae bacterium]